MGRSHTRPTRLSEASPPLPALIWSPFADAESAQGVTEILLEEGLVACGNIIGGVRSVFRWQGRTENAEEAVVVFKTNAALLDKAVARLAELHPYEEPAIVGWICDAAAPATIGWLAGLPG